MILIISICYLRFYQIAKFLFVHLLTLHSLYNISHQFLSAVSTIFGIVHDSFVLFNLLFTNRKSQCIPVCSFWSHCVYRITYRNNSCSYGENNFIFRIQNGLQKLFSKIYQSKRLTDCVGVIYNDLEVKNIIIYKISSNIFIILIKLFDFFKTFLT